MANSDQSKYSFPFWLRCKHPKVIVWVDFRFIPLYNASCHCSSRLTALKTMNSKTRPIPVEGKRSKPPEKAASLPGGKTKLSKTTSSPVFTSSTSSVGAELRRRSDSLFHSCEQLHKDEVDGRNRRSNISQYSSEDEDGRRSGIWASPVQNNIDEWLKWMKNRRTSIPNVTYGSSTGTSV